VSRVAHRRGFSVSRIADRHGFYPSPPTPPAVRSKETVMLQSTDSEQTCRTGSLSQAFCVGENFNAPDLLHHDEKTLMYGSLLRFHGATSQ